MSRFWVSLAFDFDWEACLLVEQLGAQNQVKSSHQKQRCKLFPLNGQEQRARFDIMERSENWKHER